MQTMERGPVHGLGLRFLIRAHLTDRVDTPGMGGIHPLSAGQASGASFHPLPLWSIMSLVMPPSMQN